ncbi:hypothetical protein SLS58_010169 [Diplodia intermedia]|uniref:S-adenosyl-L-methionine-dependent methyltransferase n=1 Tax=Diplodia intermedia TaxID=856260 RepID=A0ABR3T8D1_9PEZI
MSQPTENPAPQHIEADDVTDETDSSYDSDLPSTSSLSSSITDYEYENGRRYHSFKKDSSVYFAPNDEVCRDIHRNAKTSSRLTAALQDENDRLDLVHHMITLRLGGRLHLAPIKKDVQEILDLGTGTGIWAIQMGDEYESARILGNDLSPIQPAFVPPNVHFEIDDIEATPWTHTRKFDYIHARYLLGAIRDWPGLVARCAAALRPGGWLELQDFTMQVYATDGSLPADSYLSTYLRETLEGMRAMGVEPEPGEKLRGWVEGAGLENKQVGLFNLANFADGLEGFSMRILTGLRGWKKEEVEVHVAELRKELKNRAIHPQHDMYVVYGQKPLDAE